MIKPPTPSRSISKIDHSTKSLDELVQHGQELLVEIQNIQTQLGDRNKSTADGSRLDEKEFWEWRQKAKIALNIKLDQYREVKKQIRIRKAMSRLSVGFSDVRDALGVVEDRSKESQSLLRRAYAIIADLEEEDDESRNWLTDCSALLDEEKEK